jgi:hypothetical protein
MRSDRIFEGALAAGMILVSPLTLGAQGCALCYQSAAASGATFIHALKDGILILLFPPILIGIGIAIIAYRKRNVYSTHERPATEARTWKIAADSH